MTEPDNPQKNLPREDVSEEVSSLYKRVHSDADRKRAAQALADGIHHDTTARDYGELLSHPGQDVTREELLRRDFFKYGSTLKSADDVELVVQYLIEADHDRTL